MSSSPGRNGRGRSFSVKNDVENGRKTAEASEPRTISVFQHSKLEVARKNERLCLSMLSQTNQPASLPGVET